MSKPNDSGEKTVNELSGTIDLESTLVRAEALFRRFQRLVEAVDKKDNFPAPRLQDNSSLSGSDSAGTESKPCTSSNTADNSSAGGSSAVGKAPEQKERIITPELRGLLSRKVEVLPRKEVRKQGDGLWSREGK